ncbi:hypothetical protein MMC12_008725, partial [Toensbergia leucococca]|nr:hypothetical protein [Toensbergia leucococca]
MDDFFSTTDVTRPKVLILHALGGQGKSQIALEYCRRLRESHQGIFWINASSETTTTDAFEMIVNALELGNSNEKIKDVLNILGQWRTPWILVFDNYDAPGTFRNLKNFFPTVGRGKIIITSRNQGLDRFGSKLLEVPAMTSDEGLELLLREPVTLKTTNDEARRIVDRLGGLALAIDQAAAYIENKRMAIEDFIPTYEEARKKILDFIPEFGWEYSTMQVHGREEEAKALSAFATWEMSFEQLEPNDPQRHESAGHFLTLSAFVDHLNFAEDLFRTSWKAETLQPEWLTIFVKSTEDDSESDGSSEGDLSPNEDSRARSDSSDEQCRRLLGNTNTTQRGSRSHRQETRAKKTWSSEMFQDLRAKCLQLSLLRIQNDNDQSNRGSPVYSLHPLIRDWLQLRLKKNKRRDFCQEAISVVSVSIESFESQMTVADQKQVLLAHMNACLLNDKRFSKEGKTIGYSRGNIASRFGVMYRDQGDWSKAEELFKQVIEMKTRVLGPEHSDTLTSMGNLAWTFQDQGRWKEAEGLHERVMEAMKRVSGPEHPNTLIIMNNLAGTFRNQGRWKEAEGLHERVMETRKRVLGPEHPKTLNSMHNLALTFWNQGRWKEAEGLQIKVTEAMKRVSGPEHPYTLTSMNNLAGTFQNQGRWKEAEELFKQVIEIEKRVLGPEHPDTLNSMNNLAWTIRSQGRWKEAEGLQIKVMEAMKRVLGPEHPDTLA